MLEITKIREDATRREAQNQIESPKDTNPEASLTFVWSLRKHFGGGVGGGRSRAWDLWDPTSPTRD